MTSRAARAAVITLLVFAVSPRPVRSATASVPASADNPFIRAFIAQQQATTTYAADLRQTLHLRGLREPVVSTGHLYFRAPGQLAMIFDQPAGEYLIVTDGTLYLKKSRKPLRQQKLDDTRRPGSQDMLFLLDLFAHGATNTLAFFQADLVETNDEVLVTLTPHQRQPRSREPVRIENWIRTRDHELRQVRVEFENSNAITYEFLNPQRNHEIDPVVFEPPDRKH